MTQEQKDDLLITTIKILEESINKDIKPLFVIGKNQVNDNPVIIPIYNLSDEQIKESIKYILENF